ncbi:MAG TPA: hypothetical protein VNW53_06905 [Phenylobacterium sp.]|jgi:hypothetical protein|uniref:hypothetical protein n=1 Tax=Phenylobacterium sp. TaxID=1871053 RepID=UPI002C4CAD74|nr:hypothetical protein [Phenylobacterium sp.]HXA38710.1 hypothetical protein [Phenylobacterium sp.]
MQLADLIQLAVSAAAVAAMVGLAALATRGRGAPVLDEAAARRWLADEFPDARIGGLWIAADGLGAVARSGETALVLSRMGDGYVARAIAWDAAARAGVKDGRVALPLGDFAAPRAVLALGAWPPRDLAA